MGRYILRAFKYFIKLMILLVIIFALMVWSGTSTFTFDNFFAQFFGSVRGQIFSAIVLIWCAYYPRVEFITRKVTVNFEAHRSDIIEAMHSAGLSLTSEQNGVLRFRSASLARRLWQMWEDAVELRPTADGVEISGSRRNIANVEYKIKLYSERDDA